MPLFDRIFAKKIDSRAAEVAKATVTQTLSELNVSLENKLAERKGALTPVVAAGVAGKKRSPYPLYHYDNPLWWMTPQNPKHRPNSIISIDDLRRFAEQTEVIRACINYLKREVVARDFKLGPKDPKDDSPSMRKRVDEAHQEFTRKGRLGMPMMTRADFEGQVIEDLLVVGASAIWMGWSKGGDLLEVIPVDASTIRPRIDAYGWPGPDEAWYEQWIMGMKVADFQSKGLKADEEYKLASFRQNEMLYTGLNSLTYTPYFKSPIEYLLSTATTFLAIESWNRNWLTKGTTPSDIVLVPPEWTPDQIQEMMELDQQMIGNMAERRTLKYRPSFAGVAPTNRRDHDFESYNMWLTNKTCAVFNVHPSSLGFNDATHRSMPEDSVDTSRRIGVQTIADHLKGIYDELLAGFGYDDIEVIAADNAEESASDRTARSVMASGTPLITINEGRKMLGLTPLDDPKYDEIFINTQSTPGGQPTKEGSETTNPNKNGNKAMGSNSPTPQTAKPSTKPLPKDPAKRNDAIEELRKWRRKALNSLEFRKTASCPFDSQFLSTEAHEAISEALQTCVSAEELRALFADAEQWD